MQVSNSARRDYTNIVFDIPTTIAIPGTKKVVKIKGIKPYTIERLTKLWLERENTITPEESSEVLRSLCIEPYFAIKEAVLLTLNSWWKIHLFYGLKWRIWAKIKGYTEEQMSPIIQVGKKKLPLMAHWTNMAFSVDMRNDWMKMTTKEAEQYRAELLSVASQVSSKSSPSMEGRGGSSSD